MRRFLKYGVDPSLNIDGESSPFDVVASSEILSIVSHLLEHGAKLDDSNALQFTASGPIRILMMTFILECGFNINAFDVSKIRSQRGQGSEQHCILLRDAGIEIE